MAAATKLSAHAPHTPSVIPVEQAVQAAGEPVTVSPSAQGVQSKVVAAGKAAPVQAVLHVLSSTATLVFKQAVHDVKSVESAGYPSALGQFPHYLPFAAVGN